MRCAQKSRIPMGKRRCAPVVSGLPSPLPVVCRQAAWYARTLFKTTPLVPKHSSSISANTGLRWAAHTSSVTKLALTGAGHYAVCPFNRPGKPNGVGLQRPSRLKQRHQVDNFGICQRFFLYGHVHSQKNNDPCASSRTAESSVFGDAISFSTQRPLMLCLIPSSKTASGAL